MLLPTERSYLPWKLSRRLLGLYSGLVCAPVPAFPLIAIFLLGISYAWVLNPIGIWAVDTPQPTKALKLIPTRLYLKMTPTLQKRKSLLTGPVVRSSFGQMWSRVFRSGRRLLCLCLRNRAQKRITLWRRCTTAGFIIYPSLVRVSFDRSFRLSIKGGNKEDN